MTGLTAVNFPLTPPGHRFCNKAVKMAVARPIRMIGAACILLCLFLIFQINQSDGPSFISKGSKGYNGMKKDPLLDRASHSISLEASS
jgi:hypothetical protein